MVDKNSAIIEYLFQCKTFSDGNLFFNFAEEEDNTNQFVKVEEAVKKKFIDGSELKRYSFNLIIYKSIAHNALIRDVAGTSIVLMPDENMEDIAEVQAIIDWINQQNDDRNFPDFGEDCIIDSVISKDNDPNLYAVDTSVNPPLAKYSILIQVEYLDRSKTLFK